MSQTTSALDSPAGADTLQMKREELPLLDLLTPAHREVLILSTVGGLSIKEALRRLRAAGEPIESEETIKTRLHRARKELARMIRTFRDTGDYDCVQRSSEARRVGNRVGVLDLTAETAVLEAMKAGTANPSQERVVLHRMLAARKRGPAPL